MSTKPGKVIRTGPAASPSLLQSSHQPLSPHFTGKDTEALSAVPSWVTQWSGRAIPHSQMADPRVHLPDHQTPCLSFPSWLLPHHLFFRRKPGQMPMEKRSESRRLLEVQEQTLRPRVLPSPRHPQRSQGHAPQESSSLRFSLLPGSATASSLGIFRQYPQHPSSSSLDSQPLTLVLHPPSHLPLVVVRSFFVPVPAPLSLLGLTNSCSAFKTQCICPLLPRDHIIASAAALLTSAAALSVQSLPASPCPLKGRDDVISTLDPWYQHRLDTQWEKRHT